MSVYIYTHVLIYIYIERERETLRHREASGSSVDAESPTCSSYSLGSPHRKLTYAKHLVSRNPIRPHMIPMADSLQRGALCSSMSGLKSTKSAGDLRPNPWPRDFHKMSKGPSAQV